jgi:hypothetical protein
MDGPTIDPVVGVAFGCAWGVAGATGLPRPWQAWAIGCSIGISAVLSVALALPHKQRLSGSFRDGLVVKTVRSAAVSPAGDRIHRRVAFPWLVEGDRPLGLSLDRTGDVLCVQPRGILARRNCEQHRRCATSSGWTGLCTGALGSRCRDFGLRDGWAAAAGQIPKQERAFLVLNLNCPTA